MDVHFTDRWQTFNQGKRKRKCQASKIDVERNLDFVEIFDETVRQDWKMVDQPSVSGSFERGDVIIAESHLFTNQCVFFPLF